MGCGCPSKPNAACCGMSGRTGWWSSGPGWLKRKPRCRSQPLMRRRISSGHHQPSRIRAGTPSKEAAPGVRTYGNADALVDVARGFLISAPQDRSGEDRTLVVVQVSAEQLARNVPAATPDSNE